MNNDKTLRDKFISNLEYPVWYYKELQPVSVDFVIFNLLKESFVVDINNCKHEITFGKNRKSEIGSCITYDDINNSKLCSYDVIEKGFRDGEWFIISDTNTSDEFKEEYKNMKIKHERNENKEMYLKILKNVINSNDKLSDEEKSECIVCVENSSYEELEDCIKHMCK